MHIKTNPEFHRNKITNIVDAIVGRFISEDPISFAAGDVNLYRYVGNNPVDKTDPSGTIALIDDVTILAIVVVVIGIGIAANNIDRTLNRKRDLAPPLDIPVPLDPPCNDDNDYDICQKLYEQCYKLFII